MMGREVGSQASDAGQRKQAYIHYYGDSLVCLCLGNVWKRNQGARRGNGRKPQYPYYLERGRKKKGR